MPTMTGPVPAQEERRTSEWRKETNLAGRYGKIGISAVAAALRYSDAGKNPAYAPVVLRTNLRLMEMELAA